MIRKTSENSKSKPCGVNTARSTNTIFDSKAYPRCKAPSEMQPSCIRSQVYGLRQPALHLGRDCRIRIRGEHNALRRSNRSIVILVRYNAPTKSKEVKTENTMRTRSLVYGLATPCILAGTVESRTFHASVYDSYHCQGKGQSTYRIHAHCICQNRNGSTTPERD